MFRISFIIFLLASVASAANRNIDADGYRTSDHLFTGTFPRITDTLASQTYSSNIGNVSTGTLGVANGGTGQSSNWTQYGVIYASTTGVQASTAAGTSGYLLTSNNSSAPTYQQLNLASSAAITGVLPVANTTVATQVQSTCNTSATIDWSTGRTFTMLLTNAATCAVTMSNKTSGQSITIKYIQPASTGSALISYVGTTLWAGGTTPTMTTGVSKKDVCTFVYDGTDVIGSCVQDVR